jgi:hypothetical protein
VKQQLAAGGSERAPKSKARRSFTVSTSKLG